MNKNSIDNANRAVLNRPLYDLFTAVPRRYDLVNHLITWSMDKQWRQKAACECLSSRPEKVLDLCCGTGDLAIKLAQMSDRDINITGLDYSQPMLDIAVEKARSLAKVPMFVSGDASALPFPNGFFDCVGISFAFRNLTYKNPLASCHISEVLRVLKPGGRFIIVESSQPKMKLVRKLFHLYLRWYVFKIGSFVSGNKRAYHYLAESAARFYSPEELKQILGTSGFRQVSYCPLFFGVAGIYVAIK
jgi:demethylmenaquinone methyltransferase/2-methoxy-6-polyprenyl-1,4-benzoquinol methylase